MPLPAKPTTIQDIRLAQVVNAGPHTLDHITNDAKPFSVELIPQGCSIEWTTQKGDKQHVWIPFSNIQYIRFSV